MNSVWNLLTGTATRYLLLPVNIAIGVFLMPYTVRHLGTSEYGLWMVVARRYFRKWFYWSLFVQYWHLREHSLQRVAAMVAALAFAATVARGQSAVQLTIADGCVSLVAHGATLQQILADWTRVGGTQIDNVAAVATTATPSVLPYAAPTAAVSQVQPIIGLDGRPVPDDHTNAPPPAARP
jgi:hypothetical protein